MILLIVFEHERAQEMTSCHRLILFLCHSLISFTAI